MRVSIIGSGYVGIVVGTCLAKLGNKVTLIDIDKEKTKAIIYTPPGLEHDGANISFCIKCWYSSYNFRAIIRF